MLRPNGSGMNPPRVPHAAASTTSVLRVASCFARRSSHKEFADGRHRAPSESVASTPASHARWEPTTQSSSI